MLDWQTGSSNVVFKSIIRYAFGIEADYTGIWIQPANWQPFKSFSLGINIKGYNINLQYLNKNSGTRKYLLNKNPIESVYCTDIKAFKVWIGNRYLSESNLIEV